MRFLKMSFLGVFLSGVLACSDSPQQADPNFTPQNTHKTFSDKNRPVVFIDEAHKIKQTPIFNFVLSME